MATRWQLETLARLLIRSRAIWDAGDGCGSTPCVGGQLIANQKPVMFSPAGVQLLHQSHHCCEAGCEQLSSEITPEPPVLGGLRHVQVSRRSWLCLSDAVGSRRTL